MVNEDECRLTEEKMKDRRFRKSEEIILESYSGKKRKSVFQIMRGVGLTRSTFYNHHRAARNVLKDYDEYIFKKYLKVMAPAKGTNLRKLYFEMLRFIFHERKVFKVFLEEEKGMTLVKMIDRLRPEIIRTARVSEKQTRIYEICRAEILTLIEEWGKSGFQDEEIATLLQNMMFLTETAWERLKGIR
ncbi:MAG: hypothetical protein Q4B29_01345 [Candidatus Saccharibacteria bacterium]|nr:hypothetical protein [Candidatus Saccharibacteria bacterium]